MRHCHLVLVGTSLLVLYIKTISSCCIIYCSCLPLMVSTLLVTVALLSVYMHFGYIIQYLLSVVPMISSSVLLDRGRTSRVEVSFSQVDRVLSVTLQLSLLSRILFP
ncbi:hypothetical protein Pmar_PMAR020463 [Perkinsus marinus ATCC 50983]|uniref:Uncharacterized protein n=1 Tax=Perkinsus marinus (strain ATCC 50983 / TXsc) TaxID=423536 RepID=C5L740_PERM5|nr:hypothetical protein Pmar_PMAR020463 [Perkinsus marinus ATCC 50983]EER07302.1 hypothetical protein Pmar_PMAR020463 [Perkinsus marinus ATCC 50983]|eukprot:XP_002775486.1 hypothetical protein Pmar_PMAR020463 [Perkinsus marinus ATCC 50983]